MLARGAWASGTRPLAYGVETPGRIPWLFIKVPHLAHELRPSRRGHASLAEPDGTARERDHGGVGRELAALKPVLNERAPQCIPTLRSEPQHRIPHSQYERRTRFLG